MDIKQISKLDISFCFGCVGINHKKGEIEREMSYMPFPYWF
jgi:hypothetical protein